MIHNLIHYAKYFVKNTVSLLFIISENINLIPNFDAFGSHVATVTLANSLEYFPLHISGPVHNLSHFLLGRGEHVLIAFLHQLPSPL